MKVYTVEEIIDLGNRVIHVFTSEEKATLTCSQLNEQEYARRGCKDRVRFEVESYALED